MRLNSRTRSHCMAAITCAVLIAFGSPAGAQAPVTADTAAAAARAAFLRLTEATQRADWKTMRPYFAAGTPWEKAIETLVSDQDRRPDSFSFWYRGVEIPEDRLRIRMLSPDTALISTPFTIRGARAMWSGMLVRGPQQWALAQTTESYGQDAAVRP